MCRPNHESENPVPESNHFADDILATADDVLQAIRELPTNQQEVIRLKFQDGLSYVQISHITKLSVSNVGFLIHTGVRALRRRVRLLEGVSHED